MTDQVASGSPVKNDNVRSRKIRRYVSLGFLALGGILLSTCAYYSILFLLSPISVYSSVNYTLVHMHDYFSLNTYLVLSLFCIVVPIIETRKEIQRRVPRKILILCLAFSGIALELGFVDWGLDSAGKALPMPFVSLLFTSGISQDTNFFMLFFIFSVLSLISFSFRQAIMLMVASFSVLPIMIYLLDRGEFFIHFEAQYSFLYFVTNFDLLLFCSGVFVLVGAFPYIRKIYA